MKEYTCLQELNEILDKRIAEERLTERVLSDVGRGVELASIVADSLPTVTKADICRKFYNECIERETLLADLNLTSVDIKDVMWDRLAEMENEDGQTYYL